MKLGNSHCGINLPWKHPHRHSKKWVSEVIPNPVKLTMENNHHTMHFFFRIRSCLQNLVPQVPGCSWSSLWFDFTIMKMWHMSLWWGYHLWFYILRSALLCFMAASGIGISWFLCKWRLIVAPQYIVGSLLWVPVLQLRGWACLACWCASHIAET